ncbi:MAG: hypothetical protein ABI697_13030, partial [Devosia sp.]
PQEAYRRSAEVMRNRIVVSVGSFGPLSSTTIGRRQSRHRAGGNRSISTKELELQAEKIIQPIS